MSKPITKDTVEMFKRILPSRYKLLREAQEDVLAIQEDINRAEELIEIYEKQERALDE